MNIHMIDRCSFYSSIHAADLLHGDEVEVISKTYSWMQDDDYLDEDSDRQEDFENE